MPLTVEKIRKDALFLEEDLHPKKKHKSCELMGAFSDIGRKLKNALKGHACWQRAEPQSTWSGK